MSGRYFRGRRGGGYPPRRARARRAPINSNPGSTSPSSVRNVEPKCPYPGWSMYLPDEPYSKSSKVISKIRGLREYLRNNVIKSETLEYLYEKRKFTVQTESLLNDENLLKAWPDIQESLYVNSPDTVINVISLAKHQNVLDDESWPHKDKFPIIRARLIFPSNDPLPFMNLKASLYGNLITLKGTVIRVSNVKPLCVWLSFKCANCSEVISAHQPDGKYRLPKRCFGCNRTSFEPLRSHSKTIAVDWQRIRLQELIQHESGRVPRNVDVEVSEDLCDTSAPGDVITITGIVKTSSDSVDSTAPDGKNVFSLYVKAASVINPKHGRASSGRKVISSDNSQIPSQRAVDFGLKFTSKDYSDIRDIHDKYGQNLFKGLVESLCPSIYGNELVKAGLILGLFGGTAKFSSDKANIPVRGDPHILIVGDPGLGKSQMLSSCARVAPRGVFVTGNTTTTAGLTVTLTKEGGNDFSLEAGALVLADRGHCCIDEFDKMHSQHQALLETMEQQAVSIAKGGLVCSLSARTAVLAAANPVGGHYDRSRTVAENLKMSPALLSRFDIVFIMIDKPDEVLDQYLSDHIMNLHGKNIKRPFSNEVSQEAYNEEKKDVSLKIRLKTNAKNMKIISSGLMKKYVAYARKYVHPKLLPEACKVLQDFYLELRQHKSSDCTPITLRQLESMIRLTEARARLELREEANKSDAEDVVEIMKSSMVDVYKNANGVLDFTRSQNGSGMSKKSSAKKFMALLQTHAQKLRTGTFTIEEMKSLASDNGISTDKFYDFLGSLNNQGYLLQKSSKVYKLLSVDF